jgi:drug/metabolite transporter (DMT)-like permease
MKNSIKFCIALALFLWASAFVGIREGLQSYSPEGLALLRFIIASLCMGILYFFLPKRAPLRIKDSALMLLCGMVGVGLYNIALNYGELTINSGMASFLISQSPLLTALFAVIFLRETISLLGVAGFLVSAVGVALIASGEAGGFKWDTSMTYILVATMCSAFYSLTQKPYVDRYHAIEVTAFYIWGGTLFLLIYSPQLIHDFPQATWNATLTTVYLGIFPAAVGLIAWGYALASISASRAGSFLYFMPFMATILGWLYLSEVPAFMSIIGGVLAICGVWLVNHSYKLAEELVPDME